MEDLSRYISRDRYWSLLNGQDIPCRVCGTALFADISGFTSLTNSLLEMLGAKEGTEELIRQLNQIYDILIKAVHHYGGSVINFNGDGIICWFDASQAETVAAQRAVACALTMQAHMKKIYTAPLTAEYAAAVKLKVAIASGPAQRFQVGDPNIQYIDVLAGKTIDRMATAEQLAQAGEIVVSADVAAELGNAVKVETWRVMSNTVTGVAQYFATIDQLSPNLFGPDIQKIDDWTPPSYTVTASCLDKTETELEDQLRHWLLKPVYEGLALGQDRLLTETCSVVPLFLKFTGINYDDETAGEKLDAYIRLVQNVLAHYEGYLIQVTIGDKGSYLYAVFGALTAYDNNDADQALAAALTLRSLSTNLDFIDGINIGLSRGCLRVGAYGGTTRRTYGVLGEAANTAAWLMSQAHLGQIVMTAPFVEAISFHDHTFRPLGSMPFKGHGEAIPIFVVDGEPKLVDFEGLVRGISFQSVTRRLDRSRSTEKIPLFKQGNYKQTVVSRN